jgi:glutathione S-transferase
MLGAMNDVVLRYFPIVGRAQPLRHALADAGITFEDRHVVREDWAESRHDPGFGGPFAGLPTLTMDGETIGETLAIAAYLGRRLGHYAGLSDAEIAKIEGISSHVYLEVLQRLIELFWAEALYPGCDVANTFARHLARMLDKLARLEAFLPGPGRWLVKTPHGGPTPADFFAAEAVEALRRVLGEEREPALRARLPGLVELADEIRARPRLAAAWQSRPARFSTHRDEELVIERLRGL